MCHVLEHSGDKEVRHVFVADILDRRTDILLDHLYNLLWNAVGKTERISMGAESVVRSDLDDNLEREWISNSAKVLELMDA